MRNWKGGVHVNILGQVFSEGSSELFVVLPSAQKLRTYDKRNFIYE